MSGQSAVSAGALQSGEMEWRRIVSGLLGALAPEELL